MQPVSSRLSAFLPTSKELYCMINGWREQVAALDIPPVVATINTVSASNVLTSHRGGAWSSSIYKNVANARMFLYLRSTPDRIIIIKYMHTP